MQKTLNYSFIIVLFLNGVVLAAPSINGVSSSFIDGAPITIYGTDFGANGPTIHIFDDFESGTVGNNIRLGSGSATVGQWDGLGDSPGKYDSTYKLSGNQSMMVDFQIHWSSGVGTYLPNVTDVFLSYWLYLPTTSYFPGEGNTDGYNWKITWLYGENSGDDDQVIFWGGDGTEPYSGWALSCNDCFSTKMWFNTDFNMYKGRWYRVWAWIKATATPNTSRQDIWILSPTEEKPVTHQLWWNGQIFKTAIDRFESWNIGSYGRQCIGYECKPRFDDVYLATGPYAQARVEICNHSTYTTSTNCSIATVTSWSDTEITATLRQGSLSSFNKTYLYVFDANGNVNPNGYPLCPDCPSPPSRLSIQ